VKRHLEIFLQFTRKTGHQHPHLLDAINSYKRLLMEMGYGEGEIAAKLKDMDPEMFGG
jgi:hypothetical protein